MPAGVPTSTLMAIIETSQAKILFTDSLGNIRADGTQDFSKAMLDCRALHIRTSKLHICLIERVAVFGSFLQQLFQEPSEPRDLARACTTYHCTGGSHKDLEIKQRRP
jgi:hypothetical protein